MIHVYRILDMIHVIILAYKFPYLTFNKLWAFAAVVK